MTLSRRRRRPDIVHPANNGRCRDSGKKRWARRADARVAMRRLKGSGAAAVAGLGTYRCTRCGDWHVGHRQKGAKR